ncbi:hypothetical protein PWR66_05455 [Paraburkholderia sp. A1RO-5]|uniref:hypothetical protein n=1 Tax=Paraburkholderia sp. A1RO-5 TaxID=3028369 RepID=UPI003B7EA1B7
MKAFALVVTLVALVPVANAEQGDAVDRALTAQMMHETQAKQTMSNSGYGDTGKTNVQSGQSESKNKSDTRDTSKGQ